MSPQFMPCRVEISGNQTALAAVPYVAVRNLALGQSGKVSPRNTEFQFGLDSHKHPPREQQKLASLPPARQYGRICGTFLVYTRPEPTEERKPKVLPPGGRIPLLGTFESSWLRAQRFGMRSRMWSKPCLMAAKRASIIGSYSRSVKIYGKSFSTPSRTSSPT